MQVTVKLFATLRTNREKEFQMELDENSIPKNIISKLDISEEDASIIMINGRRKNLDTKLEDADVVSIFPPVGGG